MSGNLAYFQEGRERKNDLYLSEKIKLKTFSFYSIKTNPVTYLNTFDE